MSAVKVPTRKQTVAARARKVTTVYPPVLVPWRSPEHLKVRHPAQLRALRRAMKAVHKYDANRAHAMLVHGTSCDLTVSMWPLDARDDHDKVRTSIAAERAVCRCEPLVMYTGAKA